MWTVYLLRSELHPDRRYVGIAKDVSRRLTEHNRGRVSSTSDARPWRVEVAIRFRDDRLAHQFERYLKTGSGAEFARRHFWRDRPA